MYGAAKLICQRLGIELQEMPGASCTGAGVLQEKNEFLGDTLNARTFAMAEDLGLQIMTICSTCQGVMSQANHRMRKDPEYLARVNKELAVEGLEYKGTANPKHLLWVMIEDVGLDKLTELITRPLSGIRMAPFYGCYLVRPTDALDMEEHPERLTALEQVIETLGATVVDFSGKTRCCGFPILTINETNSVAMVAKHTLDVKDLGADAMVTPCPLCHLNLDGQQADAARVKKTQIGLPVIHLPQLVGMALGLEPKALGLNRHLVSTRRFVAKVPA